MDHEKCDVLVVGGGPAGLRAAELVSATDLKAILADRMPTVGRKFLIAGRGGLNLTHSEPVENFPARYGDSLPRWQNLLADFSPSDLRAWAEGLGIETFIGSSGRVFPLTKQAAPLLRRWVDRLRHQGVSFRPRHRLSSFSRQPSGRWEIQFTTAEATATLHARAVILALGGASWPQTGSDGTWTEFFAQKEIPVTPVAPANCGYEVDWTPEFLSMAEGLPLKNIVVTAGDRRAVGELLITNHGLEGGALYQLGPVLRAMHPPKIFIDLKPSFTVEKLAAKLGGPTAPSPERAAQAWRLNPVGENLLRTRLPFTSALQVAALAKNFPIDLLRPRPLAEAISTAGGVSWESLDENLMLERHPGLFCAGEMIDWEAPTGGYLLQGCFATGTRAARGAIAFLRPPPRPTQPC